MEESEARERLGQIEHIIVVMMENRSFDHMLGYLSLPEVLGGRARSDIDGLTGPDENVNWFDGTAYRIRRMGDGGITKVQDPGHTGADVGQQMAHGMSGFVTNYLTTRAYQDGHDVMTYQASDNVPLFDFFADQFAVCDRWFCSVPGSTWPNRIAALAGEAGSTDNKFPPIYNRRSFIQFLPEDVSWRWYSSDPGSLRLVDGEYRFGHLDHFAFADKPTLVQPRTFFTDAMKEELPNVAWIDPNFVDLGGIQGANDDHPPTDVMAGQSLLMRIYRALQQSALWERSMLVIVYDEHGGFYDHVDPAVGMPQSFTERSEFRHFGPRIPAIVVSPFTEAGASFGYRQKDDPNLLFDHTSLIRTIMLRFAEDDCSGLPDRVRTASHLGHVLTSDHARTSPELPRRQLDQMTSWWAGNIGLYLRHPRATIPALQELGVKEGPGGLEELGIVAEGLFGKIASWIKSRLGLERRRQGEDPEASEPTPVALSETTELQLGIATAAREIRAEGKLPAGQP